MTNFLNSQRVNLIFIFVTNLTVATFSIQLDRRNTIFFFFFKSIAYAKTRYACKNSIFNVYGIAFLFHHKKQCTDFFKSHFFEVIYNFI